MCFDALCLQGSCKAYTTTTTMPEQPVTASAADMDPAEGYEFSYEDFMSSNIGEQQTFLAYRHKPKQKRTCIVANTEGSPGLAE